MPIFIPVCRLSIPLFVLPNSIIRLHCSFYWLFNWGGFSWVLSSWNFLHIPILKRLLCEGFKAIHWTFLWPIEFAQFTFCSLGKPFIVLAIVVFSISDYSFFFYVCFGNHVLSIRFIHILRPVQRTLRTRVHYLQVSVFNKVSQRFYRSFSSEFFL